MGCPRNQRTAGGGVLLPQSVSFAYSKGFELFSSLYSNFIQTLANVFWGRLGRVFYEKFVSIQLFVLDATF